VNPDQAQSCQKCGAGLPRISIEAPEPAQEVHRSGKSQLQFRRGQVVAGRYTVLNLIGQGGMGCIYKVHDNTLGEDVALKTLLPQFLEDKVVLERFYNEAKIARRLAHPNIVRVHDIGEDGKILYISMEYLPGRSLREMLDALRPGERLPISQTLRVFDQLCAALEYAHQFTIHRDIKPENVMLGQDGAVRLMDFGISKLMANTRLTNASIVMGTPFYMSPEQIRNSRDVDARADIYSVGVMLYEILTGSVPTGVPKPASQITKDVPPSLDKIVAKCVDPDPRARYQNATELRLAFQPVIQQMDSGFATSRTSLTRRLSGGSYSPQKILGAMVVLAILLAGLWGLGLAEQHRRGLALTPEAVAQPAANQASYPDAATMADYEAVMDELQRAAASHSATGMNNAVAEGQAHWQAALAESNPARAIQLAGMAVQCFLAPVVQPGGMVFVPPGSVTVNGVTEELPGFLIDEYEVTVGSYGQFVNSEPDWTMPPDAPSAIDVPIGNVTCIDAMAYAAWRGATLPTEAQWARAAYGDDPSSDFPWSGPTTKDDCNANFEDPSSTVWPEPVAVGTFAKDRSSFGCFDMIGNVSEWTRTAEPALDDGQRPDFETMMVTKGGNASAPPRSWHDRFPFAFAQRHEAVGFRCVVGLPDKPAAALAIVRNAR